ncbi:MAG: hypothetical protein ACFFDI_27565 [Promethearchaeota archaeon]
MGLSIWLQKAHLDNVEQILADSLGVSTTKIRQKFQAIADAFVVKYFDPFSNLKGILIGFKNQEEAKSANFNLIAFHKPLNSAQIITILKEVEDFFQIHDIRIVGIWTHN